MLIRLYTRMFKFLVGLCCWMFLILGFIGGMFVGGAVNTSFMNGMAGYMSMLGGVLGLLTAIFTEVMVIAPLMILFTIDTRIKSIDVSLNGKKSLI